MDGKLNCNYLFSKVVSGTTRHFGSKDDYPINSDDVFDEINEEIDQKNYSLCQLKNVDDSGNYNNDNLHKKEESTKVKVVLADDLTDNLFHDHYNSCKSNPGYSSDADEFEMEDTGSLKECAFSQNETSINVLNNLRMQGGTRAMKRMRQDANIQINCSATKLVQATNNADNDTSQNLILFNNPAKECTHPTNRGSICNNNLPVFPATTGNPKCHENMVIPLTEHSSVTPMKTPNNIEGPEFNGFRQGFVRNIKHIFEFNNADNYLDNNLEIKNKNKKLIPREVKGSDKKNKPKAIIKPMQTNIPPATNTSSLQNDSIVLEPSIIQKTSPTLSKKQTSKACIFTENISPALLFGTQTTPSASSPMPSTTTVLLLSSSTAQASSSKNTLSLSSATSSISSQTTSTTITSSPLNTISSQGQPNHCRSSKMFKRRDKLVSKAPEIALSFRNMSGNLEKSRSPIILPPIILPPTLKDTILPPKMSSFESSISSLDGITCIIRMERSERDIEPKLKKNTKKDHLTEDGDECDDHSYSDSYECEKGGCDNVALNENGRKVLGRTSEENVEVYVDEGVVEVINVIRCQTITEKEGTNIKSANVTAKIGNKKSNEDHKRCKIDQVLLTKSTLIDMKYSEIREQSIKDFLKFWKLNINKLDAGDERNYNSSNRFNAEVINHQVNEKTNKIKLNSNQREYLLEKLKFVVNTEKIGY